MGDDTSYEYGTSRGIPQGSSLSVQLWLAFMKDIPLGQSSSVVFMDDTCCGVKVEQTEGLSEIYK